MPQLLYILAFTIIAFFAVSTLIRSLITLNTDSQRRARNPQGRPTPNRRPVRVPHPELLDDQGQPINEPLLVVRSINVDDAREKLDALYNASPGGKAEQQDED